MIQHDMMLFDHGMPRKDGTVSDQQRPEADVNIEFQATSQFAAQAAALAVGADRDAPADRRADRDRGRLPRRRAPYSSRSPEEPSDSGRFLIPSRACQRE